jgi:hypothetical protein
MDTDRKHFYITLFSNASQKLYPDNTLASFTIRLAQLIILGSADKWEVGICEVSCQEFQIGTFRSFDVVGKSNVLIYCDLISPQFVGSDYIRCIRTYIHPTKHCNQLFRNIYYLPVEKTAFQDISIALLQLNGEPVDFKDSTAPANVVLHFKHI